VVSCCLHVCSGSLKSKSNLMLDSGRVICVYFVAHRIRILWSIHLACRCSKKLDIDATRCPRCQCKCGWVASFRLGHSARCYQCSDVWCWCLFMLVFDQVRSQRLWIQGNFFILYIRYNCLCLLEGLVCSEIVRRVWTTTCGEKYANVVFVK